MSVLLFDFRAHGESTGDRITFGALESVDARAALDFLRTELPAERIGAIGVSLGGAAALLGREPLPVDALVLEAVYPAIDVAIVGGGITRVMIKQQQFYKDARASAGAKRELRLGASVLPAELRSISSSGDTSNLPLSLTAPGDA